MRIMLRAAWPVLLSLLGVAPILLARHRERGGGPSRSRSRQRVGVVALIAGALTAVWVRRREDLHLWWKNLLEQSQAQTRGSSGMTERRRPRARGAARREGSERSPACARRPTGSRSRTATSPRSLRSISDQGEPGRRADRSQRLGQDDAAADARGTARSEQRERAASAVTPSARSRPAPRPRSCRTRRRSTTTSASGSTSSTPRACTASHDWEQRAADLLGHLGLYERADDLPTRFSRGLRQKAATAIALDPPVRCAARRRAVRRPRRHRARSRSSSFSTRPGTTVRR